MPDIEMSDAEILEMFGGEAQPVTVDAQEMEISLALQSIRAQLIEIADKADVGVSQLARRLHIAVSAASRFLGGESDMKVSTAVLYARALGHKWGFVLESDDACKMHGNHHGRFEASFGIMSSGTTTSGPTQIIRVVEPATDWYVQIDPKVKAIA